MTEAALRVYEDALKAQHSRNEARRIRTNVNVARQNTHPAAIRWPFELLQNALDAGPRGGNTGVAIRIVQEPSRVIFEHDGAPFTSEELAALLSGGSSKEFESEVTTGRFGTGFLVTHVLSEKTNVSGLLRVEQNYEWFDLTLNRAGDEESILRNIEECSEAIRNAKQVINPREIPSARFEYAADDDHGAFTRGLVALRQALPYLFATRPTLARVSFRTGGASEETWIGGEINHEGLEDGSVECRPIHTTGVHPVPARRTFRFKNDLDGAASALVLTEYAEDGWRVRLPENESPRIYREYPIRGSGFVPVQVILDGKFETEQERAKISMNASDKALLIGGLDAAVIAVKYAFAHKWKDAHLLLRTLKPTTGFEPANADEPQWWAAQLSLFATRLAELPIVDCGSRFLPAIDCGEFEG